MENSLQFSANFPEKKTLKNSPNFYAKNIVKFLSHVALFFAYEFAAFRTVFCI